MLLSAFSFDCDSLGKRTPREASLTSPATGTQLALPMSESLSVTHSPSAGPASELGAGNMKGRYKTAVGTVPSGRSPNGREKGQMKRPSWYSSAQAGKRR